MFNNTNEFQHSVKNHIKFREKCLSSIIMKFNFISIDLLAKANHQTIKNKIIIINEYTYSNCRYFILCFDNSLIILAYSQIDAIQTFFELNKEAKIYSINKLTCDYFSRIINLDEDPNFCSEIENFSKAFHITCQDEKFKKILKAIFQIISAYLLQLSLNKTFKDRLLLVKPEEFTLKEDEYINLRQIGVNDSSILNLVYSIKKEEILILKQFKEIEGIKLFEREHNNYLNLQNHPFIPKYYGKVETRQNLCIAMEYINGRTLDQITKLNLQYEDKIKIIFEIMIVIHFLHCKNFIYRDLKPNNIMIDSNNTVVLIDFDRMIQDKEENVNINSTKDFSHFYIAPEFNNQNTITNKVDIYSLSLIIYYIILEKNPQVNQGFDDFPNEFSLMKEICNKCTRQNANERPDIVELINDFYNKFVIKLKNNLNENNLIHLIQENKTPNIYYLMNCIAQNNSSNALFYLGYEYKYGRYIQKDIKKAIHYLTLSADMNNSWSQSELAQIYINGEGIAKDVEKGVHYLTLAADNNLDIAQNNLGYFYCEGSLVQRNMEKGIHFLKLSANQKNSYAQFNLGYIYLMGKDIQRNIEKAIEYLKLSSPNNPDACYLLYQFYSNGQYISPDQNKALYYLQKSVDLNDPNAKNKMGYLYINGIYVKTDINKGINLFLSASNQNNANAQYNLGLLYSQNRYVPEDMQKAVKYFKLSADQGNIESHYRLGIYYENGSGCEKNFNKSIKYLTYAANHNHSYAQKELAVLYLKGIGVVKDVTRSIYLYQLSANQNNPDAQFELGYEYLTGKNIKRDTNKGLYYLSLSINQNHPIATYLLGSYYCEGKYVNKNVNQGLKYIKKAVDLNYPEAFNDLGYYYEKGKIVAQNIDKAIYYYNLAANRNLPLAQYNLGYIYIEGKSVPRNVKKAITYFSLSSKGKDNKSYFILGTIYLNSEYEVQNIDKTINCYKEASSFNDIHAKNNLGVIYKNGYLCNQRIPYSKELFIEAIKKGDILSKYNLAHLYFYIEQNLDKCIELLIDSLDSFNPSLDLLCLALVKKYKNISYLNIKNELIKHNYKKRIDNLATKIYNVIIIYQFELESKYELWYQLYKNRDFVYDVHFQPILSEKFVKSKKIKKEIPKINHYFYKGFDISI